MQNPSDPSDNVPPNPDPTSPQHVDAAPAITPAPASSPADKSQRLFLRGKRQGRHAELPASVYRHATDMQQCVRWLGWFSVGLGVAQLLAPRKLAQTVGAPAQATTVVRGLGAREVGSGIALLTQAPSSPWIWSRVAGDAMDLALLGVAARHPQARRRQLTLAAAVVATVAAVDVWASLQSRRPSARSAAKPDNNHAVHLDKTLCVNRPPAECYRFWRDLKNLPRFFSHLESIEVLSETRSRWRMQAPGGSHLEWESELTSDQPDETLAWQSLPGSDVVHTGHIDFAPGAGGRGTVMRVTLDYQPPAGKPLDQLAGLFGESPAQRLADGLRDFKQLIETGEIATTTGQSAGKRSALVRAFKQGETR